MEKLIQKYNAVSDIINFYTDDNIINFSEKNINISVMEHRNSIDNYERKDVVKSLGCLSGDTIQELGGDLVFLAPDGLRSIAATDRVGDVNLGLLSSAIHPSVNQFLLNKDPKLFSSCVVRDKSQYRLFLNNQGNRTDALGILGKLGYGENGINYEWSTLRGIQATCCDSYYIGNSERVLFGTRSSGYVYRMESGNTFDSLAIQHIFKMPALTFGNISLRKTLYKVILYLKSEGTICSNLTIEYTFSESETFQPLSKQITSSSTGAVYGTAVYGTDAYAGPSFPVIEENVEGSGTVASLMFSDTNSEAPFRIDACTIIYRDNGRRVKGGE